MAGRSWVGAGCLLCPVAASMFPAVPPLTAIVSPSPCWLHPCSSSFLTLPSLMPLICFLPVSPPSQPYSCNASSSVSVSSHLLLFYVQPCVHSPARSTFSAFFASLSLFLFLIFFFTASPASLSSSSLPFIPSQPRPAFPAPLSSSFPFRLPSQLQLVSPAPPVIRIPFPVSPFSPA